MPALKKAPPSSPTASKETNTTGLEEIKNLIEAKFSRMEERMTKVEKHISDQQEEIATLVKEVEKTAKSALELGTSNSVLISDNSEKIQSQDVQLQQLTDQISKLNDELNKVKEKLDDMRSRAMRKTLVFRNIKQHSPHECWEESKLLLANEIKKMTPTNTLGDITSKIKRAHRHKENYSITIPIIAKSNKDWLYSESIKTAFIHAAKNNRTPNTQPIFVTQMYSAPLSTR